MQLEPRYYYKNLRVNLKAYHALAGAVVVQFRSPKGTWNVLDKIGYFNLGFGSPKVYFNSKSLGF